MRAGDTRAVAVQRCAETERWCEMQDPRKQEEGRVIANGDKNMLAREAEMQIRDARRVYGAR